jgi:hypothetical protein
MFVQRAGRKLYAVAYDPDSFVSYSANDLTVLAEHITAGGVLDMAYQQQPDAFIWMVRADGVAVTMAIDRAQDVLHGPARSPMAFLNRWRPFHRRDDVVCAGAS